MGKRTRFKEKLTLNNYPQIFGIWLLFFDQVVKYVYTNSPRDYLLNKGISFGIAQQFEVLATILNIFGIIGVSYLIVVVHRGKFFKKARLLLFLYTILAGGLSNLIDRIFYGGVIDYISFGDITTFNLADLFITISTISILGLFIKEAHEKRQQ